MVYFANAISGQMWSSLTAGTIKFQEVSPNEIPINATSCIGHPDTAAVLTNLLHFPVACQRINVSLQPGDMLYVAQLTGGRLPEGTTELPEGFAFKFYRYVIQ